MAQAADDSILGRIQEDVRSAMKSGDRERASALRVIADAVNQDARFGKGDPVAALRREHKKRIEAAEAFEAAGRAESAESERREAVIVEDYLPAQLDDDSLRSIIDEAISATGAAGSADMGQVMSEVMPRLGGRADGKRVNQLVRERLGS